MLFSFETGPWTQADAPKIRLKKGLKINETSYSKTKR